MGPDAGTMIASPPAETKVGVPVNALRKACRDEVGEEARILCAKWRSLASSSVASVSAAKKRAA